MSKEEIIKSLNDKKNGNDSKIVLEFCKEPRTPQEVIQQCKTKREVFAALVELKNNGALDFANGKYFTTKIGIDALNSQ